MRCLFFVIGVLLLWLGFVLSNSAPEELTTKAETQCEKNLWESQSSFTKCAEEYSESEDYREGMRSNLSTCEPCLYWCRKSNFVNCVKKVMSVNYQCLEISKNISQSFFMGIMDSLLEMMCQDEAEVIRDVTSFDANDRHDSNCTEGDAKCDVDPLLSFLSVIGTPMDIKTVEYTKRGFCRVLLEYSSCVAEETQENFEMARGHNKIYNHIKTSTSCAEYLPEGIIEDSHGSTSPAS